MDEKSTLDAANLIVHALDDAETIEADEALDDVPRMVWLCAYLGAPVDRRALADHPRQRAIVDILAGMPVEEANVALDAARRCIWGGRLSIVTGQAHHFGDKMKTVEVYRSAAHASQASH